MRKLACACLSFSAALILANYIRPGLWLPLSAALLALLGVRLAFLRERWLRGAVIALISAAIGLGYFYGRSMCTTHLIAELDGKTLELSAELLDYPQVYDDYCRAEVLLSGEGLPRVKALLYDNAAEIHAAEPGQTLSLTAKVKAADTRYGEKYDYYFSRGFYLILSAKSSISVSEGGFKIRSLPQKLKHEISQLIEKLFPSDTAPFMKALTLGDKSGLYDDEGLYHALSRAGFMHIVAVSGMHVAFLIGFLQLILGVSRRSSLICIALIWFFVAVTGCGPSAVRAGFMQSVLLAAPIVKRENDPITSLSAVLAAILFVNPYAAASVSLQLSFAAMAGIIFFSSRLFNVIAGGIKSEKALRLLNYPLKILACSLAVMVFTVPLGAIHFGYVSVLSPIGNILALWAVSFCFCGAYAACALCALIPAVGTVAAWLVSWGARYLFAVAGFISGFSFSAVYLNSRVSVIWLALTYAMVLTVIFSKLSVKEKFLIPAGLSAAALALALIASSYIYSSANGVFSVHDVGQGLCVSVISGDNTIMIDCGGNGSSDNAGDTAGKYLVSRGRDRIDYLVLTHLHADHCNGVSALAEYADIGAILIPADADDEDDMLAELSETAHRHNIELKSIAKDTDIVSGDIHMSLYVSDGRGDANERGLMIKAAIDSYDMLITGDASKGAELDLVEGHKLPGIELLVVGHHGSRYSSTGEFLDKINGDTAIISVGYNTYGHPTYETLERLDAYGYTIYRTDLNGTVEFRIADAVKGINKYG